MQFTTLLSPIKIGNIEIKNRFVVPPMGTNYANLDGTVSRQMIDYYVERAKGGFGLIIVEVTAVDPLGKAIMNEVGLWDDSQIPGFKQLVDEVHAAGAKIFVNCIIAADKRFHISSVENNRLHHQPLPAR